MTQNPNTPQYTPEQQQAHAAHAQPTARQSPGGQRAHAPQPPGGGPQPGAPAQTQYAELAHAAQPATTAPQPGAPVSSQPVGYQHGAPQASVATHPAATEPLQGGAVAGGQLAPADAKARWRSADGKPTGLALAGAGSLLAVLAFLGGTAVGHAWGGGTSPADQTQFGGPGGGRFRQFPGQGGTGTVPNQGQGQGQGTVPNQGQGQGTMPGQGSGPNQQSGTQPSTGTQDSGLPSQTQPDGQTRTT
jgi:hypothetical protein